jgi:protein ELYS
MFNYQNFDDVFNFNKEYSYTAVAVETIEANRRSLEGLFVDKIFKLLDIKRRK